MEIINGGTINENTSYYLFDDNTYWTISPVYSDSSYFVASATNFYPGLGGAAASYFNSDSSVSVRPSISLKSGVVITSGDGTQDNPYIVE